MADVNNDVAISMAQAGLNRLYDTFGFFGGGVGKDDVVSDGVGIEGAGQVSSAGMKGTTKQLVDSSVTNDEKDHFVTLRATLDSARIRRKKRREDNNSTYFATGRVVGRRTTQSELILPVLDELHINPTNIHNKHDPQESSPSLTLLRGNEVHKRLETWATRGIITSDVAAAVRNFRPSDLDLSISSSSNDGKISNDKNCPWVFVAMGAGAEMGPLQALLSMGATVVALDLPVPRVWQRLIALARDSPGNLIFPIVRNKEKKTVVNETTNDDVCNHDDGIDDNIDDITYDNENNITNLSSLTLRAGCNLLSQITDIVDWLITVQPDHRLVLGSYAYLDSADFVRVSLAMDAITSETLSERHNSALAYLCSPTDVFVVPEKEANTSMERYRGGTIGTRSMLASLAKRLTPKGRILSPSIVGHEEVDGDDDKTDNGKGRYATSSIRNGYGDLARTNLVPIIDSLVLQQGPNYFLAKRLQHWRAMVVAVSSSSTSSPLSWSSSSDNDSRYRHRHYHSQERQSPIVSSNVAPASYTKSVLKNRLMAMAFSGATHIEPCMIFRPETSNVLMTYLLLHDLRVGSEQEEKKSGRMLWDGENDDSRDNKSSRVSNHPHPLHLFSSTAVHNGLWTCGFQLRSIVELVVAYYFVDMIQPRRSATVVGVGLGVAALLLRSRL